MVGGVTRNSDNGADLMIGSKPNNDSVESRGVRRRTQRTLFDFA